MKQRLLHLFTSRALLLVAMLAIGASSAWAEEKTFTFDQINKTSGNLAGDIPTGLAYTFSSTYSTKYQLTSSNSMTLTLNNWPNGITITGVRLRVKNNASSGNGTAVVTLGGTDLGTLSITGLGSNYTSKDVGIEPTKATAPLVITISATVNSVYCDLFTITYDDGVLNTATNTTTTIDATGISNTDVYAGTAAGSLSATVVDDGEDAVEGATVVWSGDNDAVATIDTNTGAVTLVSAGTVTFTASYAGVENKFKASSDTYKMTVTSSAPYVQPTAFDINLNNTLFGTSYTGSASGIADGSPVSGAIDNVNVIYAGSGNHYINDSQIRLYPNNKLTFEAPDGYNITKIVFTSAGTWAATISAEAGTYTSETKTWTGESTSVVFTGSGSSRCDMSKAAITLEKIVPQVLASIALSGEYPTAFHTGDAFSHEGMTVTATYESGKTADVTEDATFTGYKMSTTGIQTVTVSYTESEVTKITTYNISVNAPATLTSITLSGSYPTEFEQGDAFSSEGIVVKANFDDETSSIVTEDATFSGYDMSTLGKQTVTVTYEGKTATYDITVVEKQYYALVAEYSGKYYAVNSTFDNKKYGATIVDAVNGKVVSTQTDAISWDVITGTSGVALLSKDQNKYIGGSSSKTDMTQSTSTIWWSVDDKTQGLYIGTRYLSCDITEKYFKNYASSNLGNGSYSNVTKVYTFSDGYTRTVTAGNWGTICVPCEVAVADYAGAKFYSISGKVLNASNEVTSIVLEEETELISGMPYLFQADEGAKKLVAAYTGAAVETAGSNNGLIGSLGGTSVAAGMYLLSNNSIVKAGTGCTIGANRAYIDMSQVSEYTGSEAGVKAIFVNVDDATGIEGVRTTAEGEVIYNVAGQRLQSLQKGINIVGGRKVIIK